MTGNNRSTAGDIILEVRHLNSYYENSPDAGSHESMFYTHREQILHDVSFEIRKGDVLVEIDGTVCTSSTALISKLQEYREGDVIKVKLYRAEGAEEAVGDGTSLNLEVIKEGTESNYMEVEVSLRVLENQSSALVKPEA